MQLSPMQLAAAAAAAAVAAYILLKRRPTPIAIPQKMAAVVARDNKCVLQSEWPTPPPPAAGEVCIQIRATAVNRLDCIQRSGKAPVPPNVTAAAPNRSTSRRDARAISRDVERPAVLSPDR